MDELEVEEKLRVYFDEKKLRQTSKVTALAKQLCRHPDGIDGVTLWLELRSRGRRISFASAYRILHVLVQLGLARQLPDVRNGKYYYQWNRD